MEAYVTLVATDSYASGALVLAHRLRDLGSKKEIVCLVTPNISGHVQDVLSKVCTIVPVDTLRSNDYENLRLLGRPELDITFTKIHLWCLTQYSKVVFLDADTFPVQNIDQLFERPSFSAAPDAGWPDCFNSGVFVTEPSETVFNELSALASEKGSFDGGDQGLLNTYFDSWPTSPSCRLPFVFNTTPTAQYGYAPAQQQFGHQISVLHFIGANKPWKFQRFTDGTVLPMGGNWDGIKDMVQTWWNTWDMHYEGTPPYHLLSGEFNKFDDGFQTRPIVPFDENVLNAWDNQVIDLNDPRRHTQALPPVSSISIGQPEWLLEEARRRQQQEEEEQRKRREEEEARRREEEEREQRRRQEEEEERKRREQEHQHRHQEHHNEENHHHDHHHENHRHHHEEHNNHHHEEHNHHHEEHHHHHEEHHHRHEEHHQNLKVYSMIEWDPAYQEPPKTGKLGADIPDLSSFRNVWDRPVFEQTNNWIAPTHHPEPQIMTKPEYSHYNTEDYAPDAYYPPIHHEFNPPPVVEEEHHHHQEVSHHHWEEPHHWEEHHHHHHHEEYPPMFPWDNKPDHFPPPTRIWQDEAHVQQQHQDDYQHQEHHHEEQHHEEHHHQENHHEEHHHDHHEEPQQHHHEEYHHQEQHQEHQHHQEHQEEQQRHEEYHHQPAPSSDALNIDTEQYKDQSSDEVYETEQQHEFAIDALMSPSAQSKIDEFIASLAEEEEEATDRDLIPIRFKPTSRLSGMYSPSPSGSKANSRNASRANSRSGSRRASVSNSRRNSIAIINKVSAVEPQQVVAIVDSAAPVASQVTEIVAEPESIIAMPTFTVPENVKQPQKLFATSISSFSRKTPYTSAAVTPAIGLTPDEYARAGYFDGNEDPTERQDPEDNYRPDFLQQAGYSFSTATFTEGNSQQAWDPLGALSKLKEHSESMVLRQSLQEALVKTAREQQLKEEQEKQAEKETDVVINKTPASITTTKKLSKPIKKKKYAFKSAWDDEEYDLPSALASGESSPRTPIARSMSSSDLSREIELEKERYRQQRASLMMVQPQAAVASVLEAELDLSQGTLFKRRHFEEEEKDHAQIPGLITQKVTESVDDEDDQDGEQAFVAYYDKQVIHESKKRLEALVTGKDLGVAKESKMPAPIDHYPSAPSKKNQPTHLYKYGEAKEPQPFSLMWNSREYVSNFGFDQKHKLPIYRSELLPSEDTADEIKSVKDSVVIKKDPYAKKHQQEEQHLESDKKEEEKQVEEIEKEKTEEEDSIADAKRVIEEKILESLKSVKPTTTTTDVSTETLLVSKKLNPEDVQKKMDKKSEEDSVADAKRVLDERILKSVKPSKVTADIPTEEPCAANEPPVKKIADIPTKEPCTAKEPPVVPELEETEVETVDIKPAPSKSSSSNKSNKSRRKNSKKQKRRSRN